MLPHIQDGRRFFVKTALGRDEAMFRGEATGLRAMGGERAVWRRVA